jgi:hypothetical protein
MNKKKNSAAAAAEREGKNVFHFVFIQTQPRIYTKKSEEKLRRLSR